MLTGGCLCGGVRFELTEAPVTALWCHCTRCQRRTGTGASISARVEPDTLEFIQGEELLRGWKPPDGSTKVFCSECGAGLWAESATEPGVRFVRFGVFDDDPGVRPGYHQYVAYAAPWDELPDDGLPRYDERRVAY